MGKIDSISELTDPKFIKPIKINYTLKNKKKEWEAIISHDSVSVLLWHVDKIIIAEDKYADYFNSIINKRLTPILNCKHLISKKYIPPDNKTFTLLYIGVLSPTRFLLELVDVVKNLDGIRCIIGGVGKPDYVKKLKQKCNETDNVKFIGKVPTDEVIPMTKNSDAVFCMIAPWDKNDITASTNKQFEAMVCGRPIICTKDIYSGELTKKENIGLAIPYTKNDLKQAIITLRDNPKLREELGRNALKAAIEKYNWEKQEEKLLKIYKEIKR